MSKAPTLGTVMECGCVVRMLSVRPCPTCGGQVLGDGPMVLFPVSAAPGTTTDMQACCMWCGSDVELVARVLA